MPKVGLKGSSKDVTLIVELGNQIQQYYRFVEGPVQEGVIVELSNWPSNTLFTVSRTTGISICTDQSTEIARYARIPRSLYLLTAIMLGLLHWRVLQLNTLLIWEDFLIREEQAGCLCARRSSLQEYALAFENPQICNTCLEFFRCLGAERETFILLHILQRFKDPNFLVQFSTLKQMGD